MAIVAKFIALGSVSKGLIIDNGLLVSSFTKLSYAQIASVAATSRLDAATLSATLKSAGFNQSQRNEIATLWIAEKAKLQNASATTIQSAATTGATASTLGFTAALKGLWVVMKAHPLMSVITILTLLAPVLSKIIDATTTTAKEAEEAFSNSSVALQESKTKIESLENELDNLKKRLDDLDKFAQYGSLTPDQEAERKEIEKTIGSLKEELAIEEKLAEYRAQRASSDAYETMRKKTYEVGTGALTTLDDGVQIVDSQFASGADAIIYYVDQLKNLEKQKDNLKDQMRGLASGDPQIASLNDQIASIDATIVEYHGALGVIVPEQQGLCDAIIDTSGAAAENKRYTLDAINYWKEYAGVIEDAKQVAEEFAAVSYAIFPNLSSHIKSLKTTEETVTDLRDALADFRDDGFVSMETFAGMAEVFGAFPDEFEKFVSIASDSQSTMSEVTAAANDLAEAYLNNTDFLASLTDGTVDATIATLKNIGVTNAEEVVTLRVAAARAEAVLASKDMVDATWDVAVKILEEADAAETDIAALQNLRIAHFNAASAGVDFVNANADTIQSLIDTASAAGLAAEQIGSLIKLEEMKSQIGTGGLTGTEYLEKMRSLAARADKELETIKSNSLKTGIQIGLKPTDTSGKTAAEKAAEETREAFEKIYNAKKHELDMEKITIKEFYAWLDGQDGYKKYFQAQGETLADFQKYSKEVFDGMRDVHQQYLDVFDHEISVIERTEDSENELIAKYAQKRAEVHELIKELRKYLELQNMTEAEIISNEQYRAYMDMLYSIEDEVASIQEDAYEKQAGYVNDLIDLTEELIRQETEDHIDALEEEKDMYSELIQQRKDLINLSRDQDTYERDRQNKLKEIQKVQERIAALDLDDSRAAALEKQGLLEELNKLQIELDDMQTEHYIESAEKALDDKEKAVHEEYDREIKALEDFLDDNSAINQSALNELDKMNQDLFNRLESYAAHYTDTTRDELLKMWEEVTAAAEKYGSVTNASKVYEDSDVDNKVKDIIRKMRENGQEYARSTDPARKQALADKSLEHGADLQELLGVTVERVDGTWYIGDGPNRKKLFDVYHSGTPSVGGRATIKQNETFALLEKGESVLTKKQTNVLWEALKTFDLTKKLSSSISKFIPGSVKSEEKKEINIEVVMQPTIYGDATDVTMGVIRKEARNVADIVASKLR